MAKHSSNLEMQQRTDAVYRLILDGWTQARLIPHITRMWEVKPRQARNYVYKARNLIKEVAEELRESALSEHLAARRELRRQSNDERFKLDCMQDEAKLLGLYTERHEISGKGGGAIEIKVTGGYRNTEPDDPA